MDLDDAGAKEMTMTDKTLLDDEIIDLTDLLEEGSPPKKAAVEPVTRKTVTEPDSFDLGKEIATDLDVSIEEIEQSDLGLSSDEAFVFEDKPARAGAPASGQAVSPPADLASLAGEIDKALNETIQDVPITPNEEALLLQETPEEVPALEPEEAQHILEPREPRDAREESVPSLEASPAEPSHVPAGAPPFSPVSAEALVGAVVEEFRRDMPELLEGIVRPLVQEIVREIAAATREALPGIVEKVIREEIEKLKKLAV